MAGDKQMTQEEIMKSGLVDAEFNLNAHFLKDQQLEDDFVKALGDKKPADIKDEMTVMVSVYNEMIDSYCRTRFDVEIWRTLEAQDPKKQADRIKAEKLLAEKFVTIQTIRRQILEKLNLAGQKK